MVNISSDQSNQARTLIEGANDILIVLPKKPVLDHVAAGLAMYLALSAQGKRVNIICPDPMTVEFNHLVGVDKVGRNVNGSSAKNLVISFPYQEGSIEKVSYNIENNAFNLVIEPREGYPQITPEVIRYSSSGGNTDLVITIGAGSLSDLDSIYSNNQALFLEKSVINIDTTANNQNFGKINIVDPQSSSVSEVIVNLFSLLNLNFDTDIATNLYSGIASASQNFTSPQTNAATFESAAICLRHGARKTNLEQSQNYTPPQPPYQQPANQFPSQIRQPQSQRFPPQRQPSFNKQYQQGPRTYQPKPQGQPQLQYKQQPQQQQQSFRQPQPVPSQPQPQKSNETPPDWLKPKIYKGSTLL